MKAFIIYHHIAHAMTVITSLRRAALHAEDKTEWKVKPWRGGLLRFPSMAAEAIREADDADIVICALGRPGMLAPWIKDWLERWAAQRQVANAALAIAVDETTDLAPNEVMSQIFDLAARYDLKVITGRGTCTNSSAISRPQLPPPALVEQPMFELLNQNRPLTPG